MSLLEILFGKKTNTAIVAKERLQIILAHERANNNPNNARDPDWLNQLQVELLNVIAKYININKDDLHVHLEKRDNLELLEINIALPEHVKNIEPKENYETL